MRKLAFCICENKDADQLRVVTAKLISTFVFATPIVQSLFFLNPKFQASSHLLWLYSLVRVRPGQIPRRPVFSQRGSYKECVTLVENNSTNNPCACKFDTLFSSFYVFDFFNSNFKIRNFFQQFFRYCIDSFIKTLHGEKLVLACKCVHVFLVLLHCYSP